MPCKKTSLRARVFLGAMGSFAFCADAQFATWAGPVSGSWFQPGAWLGTDTWPAGATTQAFVDAVGSPYTLTLPHLPGGLTLGTLTISSTDASVLQSAGTLTAQRLHIEAGNYTLGGGFLRSDRVTTSANGKLILKGGTVPEQLVLAGQAEMVNAATVSFQNKIQLDGGTLRLAGPTLVPSARFGGTTLSFAGNGTILFEDGGGEFRWSQAATTNITVQPGVTLHARNGQMSLLGTSGASDATFTNNGHMILEQAAGVWDGIRRFYNNGTMLLDGNVTNVGMFRVENHGLLHVGGDVRLPLSSSAFPTAVNTGRINVNSIGRLQLSADAGVTINNSGTIIVNGGELVVPRMANSGFVSITNGTLNVAGSLSLADSGTFELVNSTAFVNGTLRLGGATITTDKDWYLAGSPSGSGGELLDGTIIGTGSARIRVQYGQFAKTNATIGMPLEIGANARLSVLPGTHLINNTKVTLSGGNSNQFTDLADLSGGSIDGDGTIVMNGYTRVFGMRTGPGITVHTGSGLVPAGLQGMNIEGTLRTDFPDRPTTVEARIGGRWDLLQGDILEANITNDGIIAADGGTTVFNTFTNNGTLAQNGGTITLRNWPSGNGSIILNGGRFNVASQLTPQQLAGVTIANPSQEIRLTRHRSQHLQTTATGTLDLAGAVLDLDQPYNGALVLAGGSISNGSIITGSDRTMRVDDARSPITNEKWESTFANIALNANLELGPNSTLRLGGASDLAAGRTISIRGNFTGVNTGSDLRITSEFTPNSQLTGSGEIVFDTDAPAANAAAVLLDRAVLGPDITVRTGIGGGHIYAPSAGGTFLGTAIAKTPGTNLNIGGNTDFAGKARSENGATLSFGYTDSIRTPIRGSIVVATDGNLVLQQADWSPTASIEIHGNAMVAGTLNLNASIMDLTSSTAALNLLANAWIDNGTLATGTSGTLTARSGSSRLNSVILVGEAMLRSGAALTLQGNWLVNGAVRGEANSTLQTAGSYPSSRLAAVQLPSTAALRIGGTVDNTAGEIRVDTGSPATIFNGTAVVLGGSIITTASREALLAGTFDAVRLAGSGRTVDTTRFRNGLIFNNGSLIHSASTLLSFVGASQEISGNGTILISPAIGTGTASIEATVTLTPTINLIAGGSAVVGGTGTLNNRGSLVSSGVGRVLDVRTRVINTGTLIADDSGKLIFRPPGAGQLDNRGHINVSPTSLVVVRGNFVSTGSMNIDAALIHDYTTTNSLAALTAMLQTGYANGDWNGPGISSLLAAADDRLAVAIAPTTAIGSPSSFLGEVTDTTTVILRNTLYGDTDLNAVVNITDFARLAAGFGSSGSWPTGDMNYDGVVSAADFALLAMNYNVSLNGSARHASTQSSAFQTSITPRNGTTIPEPAQVIAAGMVVMMVQRRRCRGR